jgi:hypothetical protein
MVTVLELCGGRERGGGRVQSSAASAETERQGEEHEEPRTGRGPHALWDVCRANALGRMLRGSLGLRSAPRALGCPLPGRIFFRLRI